MICSQLIIAVLKENKGKREFLLLAYLENEHLLFHNCLFFEPKNEFHPHQFAAAILGERIGYPTFGVLKSNHQVAGKLVGYLKKDQLILSLDPFKE